MQPKIVGQRLKEYLLSRGTACESGVSEDRITEFERRYQIRLPADVRDYFMVMNGSAGDYAYGMIRFWSLDEIKSVAEEIPGNTPPSATVVQAAYRGPIEGTEDYFVFADFMYDAQLYAIHLPPSHRGPNPVVVLDGSAPVEVADTFSQFIDLYIASPESLRLLVDY